LLDAYRPWLRQRAARRIRGPLQAKVGLSDLVQMSVWKATRAFAAESFSDRGRFSAWLMTILKNQITDVKRRFYRSKKRDITLERPWFSAATQRWLRQLSESLGPSAERAVIAGASVEDLLRAVALLPAHYQFVLRKRYDERCTFPQIAEQLERSSDAVRMLHDRAIHRLRTLLESARGN
jgi:RNA polymerase sigma factor (sigma-70 family)